jgi:GH15 family glucan-1,4-alpha-glucosidase
MPLRIEDYALIGDCKTAALVGRDGSIDWLCWPRFDSAACFAALLGDADNGRWLIAPKRSPLGLNRRYRPGTLVLETEFDTETGCAAIRWSARKRFGTTGAIGAPRSALGPSRSNGHSSH